MHSSLVSTLAPDTLFFLLESDTGAGICCTKNLEIYLSSFFSLILIGKSFLSHECELVGVDFRISFSGYDTLGVTDVLLSKHSPEGPCSRSCICCDAVSDSGSRVIAFLHQSLA